MSVTPPWLRKSTQTESAPVEPLPVASPLTVDNPMPAPSEKALALAEEMPANLVVFCEEYLTGAVTGKRFDATAAAQAAGFSRSNKYGAQTRGARLLKEDERVRNYIKTRLEDLSMTTGEILVRFTEMARANVGEVVTKNIHGRLDIDPDKVIEKRQFIKGFGFDANGNPKIEFVDSHAALRDLAKAHGIFKEGVEISGPGGGAVPVEMVVKFVRPGQLEPQQELTDVDFEVVDEHAP